MDNGRPQFDELTVDSSRRCYRFSRSLPVDISERFEEEGYLRMLLSVKTIEKERDREKQIDRQIQRVRERQREFLAQFQRLSAANKIFQSLASCTNFSDYYSSLDHNSTILSLSLFLSLVGNYLLKTFIILTLEQDIVER